MRYLNIEGSATITEKLNAKHKNYLNAFAKTRRVARKESFLSNVKDPVRERVNLPLGEEGAYFIGGYDFSHLGNDGADPSISDYFQAPEGQPSQWCMWQINKNKLVWNKCIDDFDSHHLWLRYLIDHFLSPWGYSLNGQFRWTGLEDSHVGKIKIINNKLEIVNLGVYA